MTAPGRYAAADGSFAKSAGNAAARGGILIAIAVLIGFALLAWGFDGGDSDAAVAPGDSSAASSDGGSGDADADAAADAAADADADADATTEDPPTTEDPSTTEDPATTDTTAAVEVDPPSSVTVAVLNGTGQGGLAGTRGESLGALGYVWTAGNAAGFTVDESKVYYTTGYADEAKAIAEALSGSAAVLEQAPEDPGSLANETGAADAAAANVIVVLGADGALS